MDECPYFMEQESMLEVLRAQAAKDLEAVRMKIFADPQVSELVSTYRRMTGTTDIFGDVPADVPDGKRKHALAIQNMFFDYMEKRPEWREYKEAQSILAGYDSEISQPEIAETPVNDDLSALDDEFAGNYLEDDWNDGRVQDMIVPEEDPFAFLDEGISLDVSAMDSHVSRDSDSISTESVGVVTGPVPEEPAPPVHEEPAAPVAEEAQEPEEEFLPFTEPESIAGVEMPEEGFEETEQPAVQKAPESEPEPEPEPVNEASETDDSADDGMVNLDGLATYNQRTRDIERAAMEEERLSFVDGVHSDGPSLNSVEKETAQTAPEAMYFRGQKVTPEEYARLQAEAAAEEAVETPQPEPAFEEPVAEEPSTAETPAFEEPPFEEPEQSIPEESVQAAEEPVFEEPFDGGTQVETGVPVQDIQPDAEREAENLAAAGQDENIDVQAEFESEIVEAEFDNASETIQSDDFSATIQPEPEPVFDAPSAETFDEAAFNDALNEPEIQAQEPAQPEPAQSDDYDMFEEPVQEAVEPQVESQMVDAGSFDVSAFMDEPETPKPEPAPRPQMAKPAMQNAADIDIDDLFGDGPSFEASPQVNFDDFDRTADPAQPVDLNVFDEEDEQSSTLSDMTSFSDLADNAGESLAARTAMSNPLSGILDEPEPESEPEPEPVKPAQPANDGMRPARPKNHRITNWDDLE